MPKPYGMTTKGKIHTYLRDEREWVPIWWLRERFAGYSGLSSVLGDFEVNGWIEYRGKGREREVRWIHKQREGDIHERST